MPSAPSPGSPGLSWARLVRVPNLFTACGDAWMGGLIAAKALGGLDGYLFVRASLASVCLYAAGVVSNDFFDIEEDRRERPFRPLPSGAIPRSAALVLWIVLLAVGVTIGTSGCALSGWIASLLALAIVSYNVGLKRTVAGPAVMGLCRSLNAALGFAFFPESLISLGGIPMAIAVGNGLYVAGLTVSARDEVPGGTALRARAGAAILSAGLLWHVIAAARWSSASWFAWLVAAIGAAILCRPFLRAARDPAPAAVAAAVTTAILGLIALDAWLVLVYADPHAALAVLALLPPAILLGRWIYAT